MLEEIIVAQKEENVFRRWFRDDYFELILWYNPGALTVRGFQLCYDIRRNERSLTWTEKGGFAHHGVDEGDLPLRHPSSPVLVEDGMFPGAQIIERFLKACPSIDESISRLVISRINEYAGLHVDLDETFAALENGINVYRSSHQHVPEEYRMPPDPLAHEPERRHAGFGHALKDLCIAKFQRIMGTIRTHPAPGRKARPAREEYTVETSSEDFDDLVKKSRMMAKKISRKKR